MFLQNIIRRCLTKNNITNILSKRKKSDNINKSNLKIDTDKICDKNCANLLLKTKLKYSLAFFSVGGIVEIYTYSKTNDFSKSTGFGWGFLMACMVIY